MKKRLSGILAILFGILFLLGVLTLTDVLGLHEIADAISNNTFGGACDTTNVQDAEKELQNIVAAIEKVVGTQEAMTSEIARLTANLDTSNETFHKEVIALLEAKGLHCCCCKCSSEGAPETQAPVVTVCSHANTKYTIGDGVHYKKCTDCGDFIATINCKYNSNGYCYTCGGYRKPAETTAPACTHATTYVRGGNGVHSNVCTKCGLTVSTVNCTYTSGKCVCGNECAHTTQLVPNTNDTHSAKCSKCGVTVSTVNCTYTSGKCVCGNTCQHTTQLVPNSNDTHSTKCTKCGVTVSTVNCTYTSGKCVCGNECAHTTQLVPNTNDTHSAKCTKCNVVVAQEKCTFDVIYGKCSCGNTEGVIEYGHHTIYVGTDDDDQIIKPNPNQSAAEQIIRPNPGSNVIKPNQSAAEQIIRPNPGSNVIKPNPNPSNNDKDYTCTDPIRPDGGQIIIKPNPGGSNIIAPNPTN